MKEKVAATEIYKRKINKHLCDIDPKLNKGNQFNSKKNNNQNMDNNNDFDG